MLSATAREISPFPPIGFLMPSTFLGVNFQADLSPFSMAKPTVAIDRKKGCQSAPPRFARGHSVYFSRWRRNGDEHPVKFDLH